MTTSVHTLSPYLLLPGCDDAVAYRALELAAREFCRRTSVWREEITVTLGYHDTETTLALPGTVSGIILRLISVWINDGSATDKNLSSRRFSLAPDGTLSWNFFKPNAGDILTATVSVYPALGCVNYPDEVISRWSSGIIAKAKADLLTAVAEPAGRDPMAKTQASLALEDYEREVRRASWGTSLKSRKYFSMRPAPPAATLLPGSYGAQNGYADPKES